MTGIFSPTHTASDLSDRNVKPRVSIGLPVYNGENFVSEAIESILSQTFKDLELVISDNASTDQTEEICRAWAERDQRIHYHRNKQNLGASENYTLAFERARGTYFKWVAHDDVYAPTYIERCVEVLDREPNVVLCHTRRCKINERGEVYYQYAAGTGIDDAQPHARFRRALESSWHFVWGLGRREIIAQTTLLGPFVHHDIPYISRLSLFGDIQEVPETLCLLREHPERYSSSFKDQNFRERISWYDPRLAGAICFPSWRLLKEHVAAVFAAPLSFAEKLSCFWELGPWSLRHKNELWHDALWPLLHFPVFGSLSSELWTRRTRRIAAKIRSKTGQGDLVIVVDDDTLGEDGFRGLLTTPFTEKDGRYWGRPETDEMAIEELRRLKAKGAKFIAFTEPSLWWLKHYQGFNRYLRDHFDCVSENKLVVIFDLTAESKAQS